MRFLIFCFSDTLFLFLLIFDGLIELKGALKVLYKHLFWSFLCVLEMLWMLNICFISPCELLWFVGAALSSSHTALYGNESRLCGVPADDRLSCAPQTSKTHGMQTTEPVSQRVLLKPLHANTCATFDLMMCSFISVGMCAH